jgi:ketosteroid isomerase-like protein
MTSTTEGTAILSAVLDRWKEVVDAHQPERVAAEFTEDAVFQDCTPTASDGRVSPRTTTPNRTAPGEGRSWNQWSSLASGRWRRAARDAGGRSGQ